MELSLPDLRELVAHAATIIERFGADFQTSPVPADNGMAAARLEQWQQVVAPGDPAKFARRLAWAGLTVADAQSRLGRVGLVDDTPLPTWAETLQAGLHAAGLAPARPDLLDPAAPLPFQELLAPFVAAGRQKLLMQADYNLLSEAAQIALERSLLRKLSLICLKTFGLEFSMFRLSRQSALAWPLLSLETPGRELYDAFVCDMLAGKLATLFQKYSMLARLVATTTDLWVEANGDFLQRLAADRPDLEATFGSAGAEPGPVVDLQTDLSDPHDGGRTVCILTFAGGLNVVYKPRPLAPEENYFQFLTWLNEHGVSLPFKVLRVLNRGTYGWVEYVTPTPCQDKDGLGRYYRRGGMLLALLYILEATDCHFGNIIANGEYPLLIDVETLLHPRAQRGPQTNGQAAQARAQQQLLRSVLRTALLPHWKLEPQGQTVYDSSGLGGTSEQELRRQVTWQHLNTDRMDVGYGAGQIGSVLNVPFEKETNLSPADYFDEVMAGFEQMYKFLQQQRPALLDPTGPLHALAQQSTRFLFRDTMGYVSVLQKALNPKFLQDGIAWSIQLDVLSRWLFAFNDDQPAYRPLLQAEQEAMTRLDIPYFITRANSDVLLLSAQQNIPQFFSCSGHEAVLTRLRHMDDDDLVAQLDIIRATYCARFTADPHQPAYQTDAISPSASALSAANLEQAALQIAVELRRRAIFSPDGSEAAWIGLNYLPEVDRFQLQPLSYDLYSGNGGIALFLAALTKVTGGAEWRDLALAALRPICLGLPELQAWPATTTDQKLNLGAAFGLGAIIYSLTRAGLWLDRPDLLTTAWQVAGVITPEVIAEDDKLDVMSGAAGAILGLLTLYRANADPWVLDLALACGQHLLDKRVADESGQLNWPARPNHPAGFAHGADGMTYALLQLHQAILDNQRAGVGEQGLETGGQGLGVGEQLLTLIPHPSSLSPQPSSPTWCRGAVGLGLARLGGLAALDTPEIRQEIDLALQVTLKIDPSAEDHLCCGNFGRLELLVVAAQSLARPDLLDVARQQAAQLLVRANERDGFCLFSGPAGNVYHPGFFRGMAGIGYQLLRLAYPDVLPSVLVWG
ncbi:MAG: type 2 lantipeptide synthetase LanM family protein [Anaerolineae bacterium]|nr:type 2 lantipeptide synthetase LanM family protein [Anaerolineae bacterium]